MTVIKSPSGLVLVDPRTGAKQTKTNVHDVQPMLEKTFRLPAFVSQLDAADVCVAGAGRQYGIEIKTMEDLVDCIMTGRFASNQLPGLIKDYDAAFLVLVEKYQVVAGFVKIYRKGGWRDPYVRPISYHDLRAWMMTITVKAGVHVVELPGKLELGHFIATLYAWAQVPWDQHTAHCAFYMPPMHEQHLLTTKPGPVRLVAKEMPDVGWKRSIDVAKKFKTVREMANAGPEEWITIPGFGKVRAQRVVEFLTGEKYR